MINRFISYDDKKRCLEFSKKIILSNNQYDRFSKNKYIQIQRTFIGKLAELIFLKFLNENDKKIDEGDMFEIYRGKSNVDSYDFITKNQKKVEIKSASKDFHKRIMVPKDQWHITKDYYVGIKIFAFYNGYEMDLSKTKSARIYGYCSRSQIEKSGWKNFGEGECKFFSLNKMNNINELLEKF